MKRFGWIAAALFLVGGIARADALLINGAGATFPFPLYSKWFTEYNKLHPDLRFNYQSIGSGGGIKQITEKTVDFGASRRADDRRRAGQGARHRAHPDGARRGRGRLQRRARQA